MHKPMPPRARRVNLQGSAGGRPFSLADQIRLQVRQHFVPFRTRVAFGGIMAVQSDLEPHGLPELVEQQGRDLQRSRHGGKIRRGFRGIRLKPIQGEEE
jgi:hypothetical protein